LSNDVDNSHDSVEITESSEDSLEDMIIEDIDINGDTYGEEIEDKD